MCRLAAQNLALALRRRPRWAWLRRQKERLPVVRPAGRTCSATGRCGEGERWPLQLMCVDGIVQPALPRMHATPTQPQHWAFLVAVTEFAVSAPVPIARQHSACRVGALNSPEVVARATKRTRRRLRDKLHAHNSEHTRVGVHLRKRFGKSRVDCVTSTRISFTGWFRAQVVSEHTRIRVMLRVRCTSSRPLEEAPCKTRSAKLNGLPKAQYSLVSS